MNKIRLRAYGKINISLDIIDKYEDGYHKLEMIMHQIELWDDVYLQWREKATSDINIVLKTNKFFLPTDERNLAYKGAEKMAKIAKAMGKHIGGSLRIDIGKKIPIAAGLAGGSSNCAAVMLGVNKLWDLGLSVTELIEISKELGTDIGFSIMGIAKKNKKLGKVINFDEMASCCALAKGKGNELIPLKPIKINLLLSKPPISVSTKEVYTNLDKDKIECRPNTKELIDLIDKKECKDINEVFNCMENVLEIYTLSKYAKVRETKELMTDLCPSGKVMMSGSGPTIFALSKNEMELEEAYDKLKKINLETYKVRTTI